MHENESISLSKAIKDKKIRDYLYLDLPIDDLINNMCNLRLLDVGDDSEAPFTAKVRGYTGARDKEGGSWLVKEITREEAYLHKLQEMAYYMDFLLQTQAAPTILLLQEGHIYRATKHIKNAMQIGSYNYLDQPFKKMLANDLINRWLFFDEDRNPNNYMVIHDFDNKPYIVVIDYNKVDLHTKGMKIKGNSKKFGWLRAEKTRFLTLLKPEHFNLFSIEDFENRLTTLMEIDPEKLNGICRRVFSCSVIKDEDVEVTAELVTNNLIERREYINNYFTQWFTPRDEQKEKKEEERYAGLGKSFLDYYKRKK